MSDPRSLAAHAMDYDNLHLGHPLLSKHTVHINDLDVYVLGLDEIKGGSLPVAVIMIAHGWANRAKQLDNMASGIVGEIHCLAALSGRRKTHDVIVVTLDQRNHGERKKNNTQYNDWSESPYRLIDMPATVMGGVQDHGLIMDFLPSYIFPHGERVVDEWMSAGISMGGHVTWRLLHSDPRVKVGIPIITIPPEVLGPNLLLGNLKKPGPVIPVYPPGLKAFYEDIPAGQYGGKHILSLHGALDKLISPKRGAEQFGKNAQVAKAGGGDAEMWVQEDKGHVVSPEMVRRAAEWFWRFGLSCP